MSIWFSNRLSSIINVQFSLHFSLAHEIWPSWLYDQWELWLEQQQLWQNKYIGCSFSMAIFNVQTTKSLDLLLCLDHYFISFKMENLIWTWWNWIQSQMWLSQDSFFFFFCSILVDFPIRLLFNFRYVIGGKMNYKIVSQLNSWHYWKFIEVSHFLWF